MTRRSPRPNDRQNRHDVQAVQPESWFEKREQLAAAGLVLGTLAYATLFFSSGRRYEWLALMLVPEVLVKNWCGGPDGEFACWDRLPIAAGAAILLAWAWWWGDRLCVSLFGGSASPRPISTRRRGRFDVERLAVSLVAGLALVSLVTFGVGLAGWLRSPSLAGAAFLTVTAALFVTARACGGPHVGDAASDQSTQEEAEGAAAAARWTATEYVVAAFAVALGAFILWSGMQPPWEFDVREYHLQAPKEWWQAGRISFLPHNVYANMPAGAEMFALAAMIFWPGAEPWWSGALVGKTVIAATAPITALVLVALGRRLGSRLAGLSAAALYLAIPWTGHVAMAGLIDGVLAMYVAAAAWGAIGWFTTSTESRPGDVFSSTDTWRTAALLGWIAGAAAACKYPGLVFVVAPCGLVAALARGSRRLDWRAAGAFALAASVVAGPWYVKNAITTGNPTYPLLTGLFGGATRTPEKDAQWRAAHRERDAQGRTYSGPLLVEAVARVGWRSEWQNPVLIPLAALGLWFGRRRRELLWLAGFAAWIFLVWWLAGHRIDRFWLPASPLLAILAGGTPTAWPAEARAWRRAALGVLGGGLAFGGLVVVSPLIGDTRVFAPLKSLRAEGQSPAHGELERLVPSGGRALLVGDAQPFDLSCEVLYSTCFDDSPLAPLVAPTTVAKRRQAFAAAGVTHVLVDWGEIARYRQPGNYGYPEYVTRALFDELTAAPAVLRPLPIDSRHVELYEVVPPAAD